MGQVLVPMDLRSNACRPWFRGGSTGLQLAGERHPMTSFTVKGGIRATITLLGEGGDGGV